MEVEQGMKIGVLDAGGGFRGVYGCGVLDTCLDRGIHFNYAIGVSAGSANLASYLAGQRGRNYTFYTVYGFRRQYASFGNFIRKHNYVDLDYVYSTLSNSDGENPLDYDAFAANPAEFYAVACDARTGETVYLDRSYVSRDNFAVCKASSALPVACQPQRIGERLFFDGGMADPVPVVKAFADGCDKVVLILTKPRDTLRTPKDDATFARILRRTYPQAAEQLSLRWKKYNDGVALAKEYEAAGKLLLLSPDSIGHMSTLKRTKEDMDMLYEKGLRDGAKVPEFLGL